MMGAQIVSIKDSPRMMVRRLQELAQAQVLTRIFYFDAAGATATLSAFDRCSLLFDNGDIVNLEGRNRDAFKGVTFKLNDAGAGVRLY